MHLLSFLWISICIWILVFHFSSSSNHEVKLVLLSVMKRCKDSTSFCCSMVFFVVICFNFFKRKSSLNGFILYSFLEHNWMYPIFFIHVNGSSWLLGLQLDVSLYWSLWLRHLRVSLTCHLNSSVPLIKEVGLLIVTLKFNFWGLNVHRLSILLTGLVDSTSVNYRTGLHFCFKSFFRVGLHWFVV